MATLVGIDSETGFTTTNHTLNADTVYGSENGGSVAVATGTADTAHLYLKQSNSESVKILVYDSNRDLIATSTVWTSSGFNDPEGWVNTPISVSITSGNTYYLTAIADDFFRPGSDGTSAAIPTNAGGSYATPPDPLGAGTISIGEYPIYLSGTVASGSTPKGGFGGIALNGPFNGPIG